MKRVLLALLLFVGALDASAQIYYNPGGGGVGGGSFTSPGAGIPVDTTGSSNWVARCLTASTGITIANACGAAGNFTISVDTAVIPTFSSGTSAVPGTGAVGTLYFKTDSNAGYYYPSTDTEHYILSIPPASLAQGDVFYINSSGVVDRLGAGTSGQFLKTQGASANPTWATINDPATTVDIMCDFLAGAGTSGNQGECGANSGVIATGTISAATATASDPNHPGLLRLLSHATNDNSGATVGFDNGSQVMFDNSSITGNDWTIEGTILLGSNSTAITNTGVFFGWLEATSTTSDPTTRARAIQIRHDSDFGDTTFMFVMCDSGSSGCASVGDDTNQDSEPSTITPSAGNYYKLKIRHANSGVGGLSTYYFSVNGETEKTFCSSGCNSTIANLPTGALAFRTTYVTRTTTGVMSADVDMMHLRMTVSR